MGANAELDRANEIVITGMGGVFPWGDVDPAMDAIFAGRDAIIAMPDGIAAYKEFEAYTAAPVLGFDMKTDPLLNDRKEERRLHPSALFSLSATAKALRQAGLIDDEHPLVEQTGLDPWRVGISIGTGMGGGDESGNVREIINHRDDKGRHGKPSPFQVIRILPDTVATAPSRRFGIKGPVMTVIGACATGNMNIIQGARLLKSGEADVMVVGGTEAQISATSISLFESPGALDANKDPRLASRPFHRDGAGFVMGEGAGILVLEKRWHAEKRKVPILATLAGYAQTADAKYATSPSGEGAAHALTLALGQVALDEAVIYINAHATGTEQGDGTEILAIKEALGPHLLAQLAGISSTKSTTGHMMGAAGAVEAIVGVSALLRGEIPPSTKLPNIDDVIECARDLPLNRGKSLHAPVTDVISNSFGFGGLNATIILRREEKG